MYISGIHSWQWLSILGFGKSYQTFQLNYDTTAKHFFFNEFDECTMCLNAAEPKMNIYLKQVKILDTNLQFEFATDLLNNERYSKCDKCKFGQIVQLRRKNLSIVPRKQYNVFCKKHKNLEKDVLTRLAIVCNKFKDHISQKNVRITSQLNKLAHVEGNARPTIRSTIS